MKFELDSVRSGNVIRAYHTDYVQIGEQRYASPFVITPSAIYADRLPPNFTAMTSQHLFALADLGAEVIVIGSGAKQHFLPPILIAELNARRIGVETMDNGAACRIYNVLAAENRAVVAAIFVGEP
ncbi:MAG: hypothetical protein HYX63_03690 [Gammaproteobacteria bacterium]|nr:hypothetical protein [Gammaproteobacteria bacterium]